MLAKEVTRKIREQRVRGIAEIGKRAPKTGFRLFEPSGFLQREPETGR